MEDHYPTVCWRGKILSLNDLLERIVTVQDFQALRYVFYNYKDRIELIEVLFYDIEKISHYSDDYSLRYKKVVNTFNYLRFHWKLWPNDYIPRIMMDEFILLLNNKQ